MCQTNMSPELLQFNDLHSEMSAAYHEAARKMGLSESAMIILYTICQVGEPCPLTTVYRLSGTSKQTISSSLHRLTEDGLVLPKSQGRRKLLTLTPSGAALASRTVLRLIAIEEEIFREWSPEERGIYLKLTRQYLDSLKRRIEEIAPPESPQS